MPAKLAVDPRFDQPSTAKSATLHEVRRQKLLEEIRRRGSIYLDRDDDARLPIASLGITWRERDRMVDELARAGQVALKPVQGWVVASAVVGRSAHDAP